jgi:peptidoglycan/xylan/chitin deacetylase (PgdA/CDA1 family)
MRSSFDEMKAPHAAAANHALFERIFGLLEGAFDNLLIAIGVSLYHCGLAGLVIGAFRRAPRAVMYHACQECENDLIRGLSINTTPAHLAAQLDFLQKHYQVVPLAALTDGALPDRALVISFDDGFRSVYDAALPLFKSRNLPATCYLVTDVIDRDSSIWILNLNWYLQRHPAIARPIVESWLGGRVSGSLERLLQKVIRHYDPQEIADLLAELRVELGPVADLPPTASRVFLNRAEIEEMARSGFTFGNHSASHAVLSRLETAECHDEIERARRLLDELPGSSRSLAYPFGFNNDAARQIAIESGYTTLMEVEGDNNPLDLFRVARLNVTSVSPAVLFARLELMARVKFRLKRVIGSLRRGLRKPPGTKVD